jgi:mRNA interferase RelE/StbE
MYTVEYRASAKKTLQKLPRNVARTIVHKINQLVEAPHAPNNNVTRLVGESGYRLRVGDWRVLYELHDDVLMVEVVKIGPRGGVYR